MFYKAIVLDNSQFYSRGTVRVRVAGFFQREMTWNLSDNFPDFIEEGANEETGRSEDFEAYLMSPLGGGRNYGVFFLPQINEKGIVAFLGNNRRKPIWLGSFFEPERDENFDISYVNIPSDDPEQEGEDSDGIIDGESNMNSPEEGDELNKNIVIRTKNTSKESAEEVDWEQQRTTNLVVLSDKEIRMRHFPKKTGWDDTTPVKWQELIMQNNEEDEDEIKASIQNDTDEKKGIIQLTDGKVNISIESKDAKATISGDLENGFEVVYEGDSKSSAKISNDGFSFSTEGDINIQNDGDVNLESGGDAYVKSQNAHFDVQMPTDSFKIAGGGDSIVLYSQLKSLIAKLENHIHVSPAGPTTPALNPDQSPVISQTTPPKIQMESQISKTD